MNEKEMTEKEMTKKLSSEISRAFAAVANSASAAVITRLELQLSADYAERVLHVYERSYPGDMRPRDAVQAARDYAAGKIGAVALSDARFAALNAADDTAADAAYAVPDPIDGNYRASDAAQAAGYSSLVYTANAAASAADDFYAERDWQLERLRERLEKFTR